MREGFFWNPGMRRGGRRSGFLGVSFRTITATLPKVEKPQGKLVRVVSGVVFDVAVDLRRSSSTFGEWVGETLSENDQRQLWVPPGFAHGFYVLSNSADLLYKCTEHYLPACDRALRWDEPELAISWPLLNGRPPILSPKDAAAPSLRDAPTYP
jgi:dTDP-4-dehydrorhamnose 3,5-epimerase